MKSGDEKERKFHISVILSVVTGRQVLSRRYGKVDGVDLLNFMMGKNILLYANTGEDEEIEKQCRTYILGQYIQHRFDKIDAAEVNRDNIDAWVQDKIDRFGEFLPIKRFLELL